MKNLNFAQCVKLVIIFAVCFSILALGNFEMFKQIIKVCGFIIVAAGCFWLGTENGQKLIKKIMY